MDSITEKRCSKCREIKQFSGFWKTIRNKDGYEGQCKACHREYSSRPEVRERSKINKRESAKRLYSKAKGRKNNLKKNYKITLEEYDAMYEQQGGKCAICKRTFEKLGVDHDHGTKTVRALLCSHCNLMLGYAFDNAQTLLCAVEYLHRYTNKKDGFATI